MVDAPRSLWISTLKDSPLGPVWVAVSDRGLAAVEIQARQEDFVQGLRRRLGPVFHKDDHPAWEAVRQIQAFLLGERRRFDLEVDYSTLRPFQRQVLKVVAAIPYGQTSTYGAIAQKLGRPRAARAVGRANASNPMPLVLPCHRVLGSDGALRGYGAPGGIATKAWLLDLEMNGFDARK